MVQFMFMFLLYAINVIVLQHCFIFFITLFDMKKKLLQSTIQCQYNNTNLYSLHFVIKKNNEHKTNSAQISLLKGKKWMWQTCIWKILYIYRYILFCIMTNYAPINVCRTFYHHYLLHFDANVLCLQTWMISYCPLKE